MSMNEYRCKPTLRKGTTSGCATNTRLRPARRGTDLTGIHRRAGGASMGMVVASAFVLLVVGVAAFQMVMFIGGSRELRHSVDAAVLNVSKRACEDKVPCGQQTGYNDVADSTGMVGLSNINRVWGKAYLINANAESMQKTGYGTGTSSQNGTQAYTLAQSLNDTLYNTLTSKAAADAHFAQIAQNKPTKLLQGNTSVVTNQSSTWNYAWIYRGEESNIAVDTGAIPAGITPNYLVQNGTTYLQGYNSMKANNENFCLTTFHANEPPHLVTETAFAQAKASVANASNPIPNCFQEAGQVQNSQLPMTASACAAANPMRGFNLAIPHSYVTVQIKNEATWIVQGTSFGSMAYFPGEGTVWQVKNYKIRKPGQGIENGFVSLGNEYSPANLNQAFNALPADHTIIYTTLLQRIKEFCPNYTKNQLVTLLSGMPYNSGDTTWYIYPVYTQPDLSDPKVAITVATGQLPGWLVQQAPDGAQLTLMSEPPQTNEPNYCWSDIRKGPYKTDQHNTVEGGTITWQPGTGFNQNLGTIGFQRNTTITFTGLP
jgi:hypothetical protein